jgi:hypothetical protein
MSKWTLFSNHGHVLVVLSRDPDARLRDVAQIVGITERAVQKIVRDLQDGGLVSVTKHGRRNRYRLRRNQPLRHTLEAHCTIGELLEMVNRHAPGLESVEEAPVPVSAPVAAPSVKAEGVPATSDSPAEAVARPAAAEPEDESVAVPGDVEAETPVSEDPSPAASPRRRKISPADDGDQGSLF